MILIGPFNRDIINLKIFEMEVKVKSLVINNPKVSPYFIIKEQNKRFSSDSIIVKVLAYSLDPLMRVWLSGARTNFRVVRSGDIFNCFGVGEVVQSKDEYYPVGTYLFGNTGTTTYFQLDDQKLKECFGIDQNLIKQHGAYKFLYLINNGLAAFQGFEILQPKQGETVVVSTASGATGLLLCHLLKKKGANILAVCSAKKKSYLQPYTSHIVDYRDRGVLREELKKTKFNKYFDNVGQSQLDLVLETIQNYGVLALCGAIEHYLEPKQGGIVNWGHIITKRLKLQGINFSWLMPRAKEIFQHFHDAKLLLHIEPLSNFIPLFLQIFKSGGSIVGKVIIDPHK